jgi:toxin ParE1/3/4
LVRAVRAGCRKLAVGSHLMFHRVRDDGVIDIVRILHRRMDVARHLS